jgi:hypothetical protein
MAGEIEARSGVNPPENPEASCPKCYKIGVSSTFQDDMLGAKAPVLKKRYH